MSTEQVSKGAGLIVKYLQQILIVAIISGGGYLFTWIISLDRANTDKDKEIMELRMQIQDLRQDLDDNGKEDDLRATKMEEMHDNTNSRLIHLEDQQVCNCKPNK